MVRIALKPLPRHEDLAEMAMMLRAAPTPASMQQPREVSAPAQIAVDDWDKLFKAVEYRLSSSVAVIHTNEDKTKVAVLECVEALGLLHHALSRERLQRHQTQ